MEKPSYVSSETVLAMLIPLIYDLMYNKAGTERCRLGGLPRTYLVSSSFERVPFYPWKDVAQEGGVVLHVNLLELRVAEMEREGGGGGFAGFDGAGEEVDG